MSSLFDIFWLFKSKKRKQSNAQGWPTSYVLVTQDEICIFYEVM